MKKLSKITLRKEDVLSDAEMKHILGGTEDSSTVGYDKVAACEGKMTRDTCYVYLIRVPGIEKYDLLAGTCYIVPMVPSLVCTNLRIPSYPSY